MRTRLILPLVACAIFVVGCAANAQISEHSSGYDTNAVHRCTSEVKWFAQWAEYERKHDGRYADNGDYFASYVEVQLSKTRQPSSADPLTYQRSGRGIIMEITCVAKPPFLTEIHVKPGHISAVTIKPASSSR